jgi:Spy/CpxP family protein refolding chaperone
MCNRAMWTTAGVLLALAVPVVAQQPPNQGSVRGGPNPLLMLRHKAVQEELKLSTDQQTKVKDLMMVMRDKMIDLIENGQREKMPAVVQEHQKSLWKILTPQQGKRLKEVVLQVHGLWAMTVPENAGQLKLTAEQSMKLRDLQAETEKQMNKLSKKGEVDSRAELQKRMAELHTKATDQGLQLLTAEQRTTWKGLVGEPFKGEVPRVPPSSIGGKAKQ